MSAPRAKPGEGMASIVGRVGVRMVTQARAAGGGGQQGHATNDTRWPYNL